VADETCVVKRKPIPEMAWVLSGAVALALVVLVAIVVHRHGESGVFNLTQSDSCFFRLVARHPFGSAHDFAAVHQVAEAPYRYGRIGLPLLGWILALGHPGWVGWSLIAVYIASIAAVPGIAAVLLDDLGAPPAAAAVVLLAPGLLLNYGHVYADPLVIALLLLASVFEGRGRRSAALVTLAAAILVKEVAVFALIPWIWSALARRDRREVARAASAVVPYLAWCVFVRGRFGVFPFLAHTYSRRGALGLPLVGIRQGLEAHTPNIGVVTAALAITVVVGLVASWVARGTRIGALALVYSLVTLCLGKNAVAYLLESARVMAVAQVFAILCIVVAVSDWRRRRNAAASRAENHGLFAGNASM
jgi:hypothetical protein